VPESDPLPPELVRDFLTRLAAARREIDTHGAVLPTIGEQALRLLAHQLRGSGGAFGFPEVSDAAGAVEDAPAGELPHAVRRLSEVIGTIIDAPGEVLLIVDDDPAITRLLEMALRRPGRRLRTAETGAEADRILAEGGCDLVVLDLFLPDEDGRRLLERWRANPGLAATPVFILSARLGAEVKSECYALGADGFFEKPFDVGVLAAAVEGRLARRSHPAPPAPVIPHPPQAGPAKILLAEDDELIARIVSHRLEKGGHRLTRLPDGGGVLARIAADPPDLLILDIKMPEVDGLEVLRRLRADPATRSLPVILLTALGEEEDVVRGFGLGADDYLVKPFSPTELAVRVDRLLHRS
jgi:DNA-binding response OmpR family regulator